MTSFGKCIKADSYIPFRDCKLTHVCKEIFENEMTLMLNIDSACVEETLSTF